MNRHELLKDFPTVIEIPVQWGEMDAYGHVNNTVFFRYFESARMEFLEQCGLVESYTTQQVGAILHSTQARFRQPLFYPDTVQIGARAVDIEADRFTMSYAVVSLTHNVVACEGSGIIVSFDYAGGTKTALPAAVLAKIQQMQQTTGA